MAKEWFIYKDDHHTGPFHLDEIKKMIGQGDLVDSDLLWKEGLADWVPAKLFFNHMDEIKSPAPSKKPKKLLKLPIIVDTPPSIFIMMKDRAPISLNDPVEVLEEINEEEDEEKIVEEKDSSLEVESVVPNSEESLSLTKIVSFSMAALLCCFVTYKTLDLFFVNNRADIKLPMLKEADEIRLKKVAESSLNSQRPKLALALDKKNQSFVLSSNHPGEGIFNIFVRAKNGKVLGIGDSELRSELSLHEQWGHVSEFSFEKGVRIYPGYYDVHVKGKFWSNRSAIVHFLAQFPILRDKIGEPKSVDVSYKTQVLFSQDSPSEFNKKLQNFNEKLIELKNYKHEGKLESYRTFKSLIDQINYHFKNTASELNRGYEIYRFEAKYAKTIGPVLRSLILDTRKKFMENRDKNPKEAENFQFLFEKGRRIGEVVSDLVTEAEKIKLFDDSLRSQLINKYENQFSLIKIELEKYAENIKILNQIDLLDASIFMQSN